MAKKGNKALVVVESPAKARTIANILGRTYEVKASVGHVRDLPKSVLGVDVKRGFEPYYIVPKEKQRVVKEIAAAGRNAEEVFLATDPDREGEAIAWHVLQAAGLGDIPVRRVVFHEITPQAVREAFRQPRQISMELVDAQQARRILDRLVGYNLSPLLWKKVRRGLSAGRVQSVALRLVADREREIQAFVAQEYWTIEAQVTKAEGTKRGEPSSFRAKLAGLVGKRKKLEVASQEESDRLVSQLRSAAYRVATVEKKQRARRPAPPFITSTLQQEASRRFGFSAQRTMRIAQQLYEGLPLGNGPEEGLITYMRTDSAEVAGVAKAEARAYISEKFGADYLPPSPRAHKNKVKRAQEAHEAIRPTSVYREPDRVRAYLNRDQLRLYTLIWQRMLASQMADARYDVTSVDIEATPASGGEVYRLRATNTQLAFPGYRQLYSEARDDDEEEDLGKNPLPSLEENDPLRLLELFPEQHFTEPPPRYTEATLIRALEERGIGRPSTYAPIISTVLGRGYVEKVDGRLRPQELGFVVNDLLVDYFPGIMDVNFTAEMEEELDEIARGERQWEPMVREFYAPLMDALAVANEAPPVTQPTDEVCDQCGKPMVIRWGKAGRFLACTGFPECRGTRPLEGEGNPLLPATEETCTLCGAPMVAKQGRFGPFLACTRYPECKGTRPLQVKIGVACPKCGGDIVEKRSRKGRTFFGCVTYPACDFTAWNRPLPVPCPECKGLLVADREGRARPRKEDRAPARRGRCTECGWRGEVPEAEPAPIV